ncbi:hypothetical protein ACIQPR_48555 [Streptomyces sp. NPDC091280]|uniref:hypothetical protein n=1 Tax=Streptomyces sp. NPDC091280 TaxID=3365984 RepID=UPI00381A4868
MLSDSGKTRHMTTEPDPHTINAMWRVTDLAWSYLARRPDRVAACLTGLDANQLEHVQAWQVCEHDAVFGDLREPDLEVRDIDAVASLAPADTELAVMMAVHKVARGETGLALALMDLSVADHIHALAICTTVMLLRAHGQAEALDQIAAAAAQYEARGWPRPYAID